MAWSKILIKTSEGKSVEAQAPVILSASRSTDIPAFYSDWLVERVKQGYLKWKNPFNGVPSYISFANTRLIVFWTKNPRPIFTHLPFFNENIKNYYFQYTLNDYDYEKLEKGVPDVNERIETFIQLSELIGKQKVIWRFDPLILTDEIGIEELLTKVEYIGDRLKNHTTKFVFSFADIKIYKKVQNNLRKSSIKYIEFNERTMDEFSKQLHLLNAKWKFEIGTCAEKVDLEKYGIVHNKCIDEDLIIKLFNKDKMLMDFLGVKILEPDMFSNGSKFIKTKDNKDKGQRAFCGCLISKDIGEYNTCPHLCEYCYANASKEAAISNWKRHITNPFTDMISGG